MNILYSPHLIFFCLFSLAILKPFNDTNANRYMGIGLMVLLCLIFLYKVFKVSRPVQIFKSYPFESILIISFLSINFFALSQNLHRYQSLSDIAFFAIASLAVWSSAFMLWIILSLGAQKKLQWLGWLIFTILGAIALWQILDYTAAMQLTQYFVSADAHNAKAISSLTRWHTIYGTIAAIGILVALKSIKLRPSTAINSTKIHYLKNLFFLSLITLLAYTGVMSQSRNFLFTLSIGLGLMALYYFLKHPRQLILLIVIAIVGVHLIVLNNSKLSHEYGQIFPYIQKLKVGSLPDSSDFIPQINTHSLTGRDALWKQGYALWQKTPLIGIGPGAYRAMNKNDEQHRNLHNFYLQTLVDTGVIGFSILMALLLLLCWKAYQAKNLIIFSAILSALIFDNYLDYSFAWVFIMTWSLFITRVGHGMVSESFAPTRPETPQNN